MEVNGQRDLHALRVFAWRYQALPAGPTDACRSRTPTWRRDAHKKGGAPKRPSFLFRYPSELGHSLHVATQSIS